MLQIHASKLKKIKNRSKIVTGINKPIDIEHVNMYAYYFNFFSRVILFTPVFVIILTRFFIFVFLLANSK